MNKIIVLKNEKSWKSLLVQTDKLLLINKSYENVEEFVKKYEEKSILRSTKEISINEIKRLSHPEKDAAKLEIEFGTKSETLDFENANDLQELTSLLTKQLTLSATVRAVSSLKAITSPLIGLVISIFLGWLLYGEAQIFEAGGTVEISGRKVLYKKLLAWLAETLGSTGSIALASIASIACLYFIYKKYTNPPNEVVYE